MRKTDTRDSRLVIAVVVAALLFPLTSFAEFGADTTGGEGGETIVVTNLADSGPGSLRAAIRTPGARVIEFQLGGVIYLQSDLQINHPNVTIAGESAPSPGITLTGATLRVQTSDVIVRHLRIRVGDGPGPDPEDRDAIAITANRGPVHDVLIDHCSASWATDEIISTWYEGVSDVTIRDSIISEGLGRTRMGLLIGAGSQNVLVRGNLFAHNRFRNPAVHAGVTAVIVNNLIYNPGKQAIHFYGSPKRPVPLEAIVVGNVVWAGPDTPSDLNMVWESLNPGTKIYLEMNEAVGTRAFQTDTQQFRGLSFNPMVSANELSNPRTALTALLPADVPGSVLSNAGARPWDRDYTDQRIIREVNEKTRSIRRHAPLDELSRAAE